jgi:hypothetical protein
MAPFIPLITFRFRNDSFLFLGYSPQMELSTVRIIVSTTRFPMPPRQQVGTGALGEAQCESQTPMPSFVVAGSGQALQGNPL